MATATEPRRPVSAAEARDVAEAAREAEWAAPSFVRDLFLGSLRLDLIHPYPDQDPAEVAPAKPFLDRLTRLMQHVDAARTAREAGIPRHRTPRLHAAGRCGTQTRRAYGGPE